MPLVKPICSCVSIPRPNAIWKRAISLAPDDPRAYHDKIRLYLNGYGDTQRARQVAEEESGRIDPQEFLNVLWEIDVSDRDYEQALKHAVLGSDTLGYYFRKSFTYYYMNEIKLAQASADSGRIILQPRIERDPLNPTWPGQLGICYALLGRKQDAIRAGRKSVELRPVSRDARDGPRFIAGLAEIYTLVGEHDAAIDQLAYLLSIPSLTTVHVLRLAPVWDPLREYPRFKELLTKYSVAQK